MGVGNGVEASWLVDTEDFGRMVKLILLTDGVTNAIEEKYQQDYA